MCRILLVDDDADLRELYGEMLEEMGHVVSHACHGEAALEVARWCRPDLVLTDWCMPRMDGIELSRRIRLDEALRDIPIILQTASHPVPQVPEVQACLSKSCAREEFDAVLKRVLDSARKRSPTAGDGNQRVREPGTLRRLA